MRKEVIVVGCVHEFTTSDVLARKKNLLSLIPIESSYRNSDGESDEDGVRGIHFTPPPGSIIYTVPPDGTHLPPGKVIYAPPVPGLAIGPGAVFYGPPPEGVRLVYGPPPSSLHIPLIPNSTLHCNVPGHLDMVRLEHHTDKIGYYIKI